MLSKLMMRIFTPAVILSLIFSSTIVISRNNTSWQVSQRVLILSQGQNIPISNAHRDLQSLNLNLVDLSGKRVSPIIHLGNDKQIEFGLTGMEAGTYFFYGHINGFKIERQVVVLDSDRCWTSTCEIALFTENHGLLD